MALVEPLDDGIGRVLATLHETQAKPNTLVLVSSDNGGLLSVAANNDPWRGGRTDHYAGGFLHGRSRGRSGFMPRWNFARAESRLLQEG